MKHGIKALLITLSLTPRMWPIARWQRRLSQKCSSGNKADALPSSAKAALPAKASDDEGTGVSINTVCGGSGAGDERRWAEKAQAIVSYPGVWSF